MHVHMNELHKWMQIRNTVKQWLNIICQEWQCQRNTTIETIYRIRYMYKTYHKNIVDTSNFIIITVNINMTWLIDKFNCKVVFNFNCVVSNHKKDVHEKRCSW